MRAFALGLVLVACGGGPTGERGTLAGAGGSAGALVAAGGSGSAGTATSAAGESGEAGEAGSAGAVDEGDGGQAGDETGAGGSGVAGRPGGGSSGAAGSHAVGGSSGGGAKGVAGSGSAGGPPVSTDPLAPFPAPGCPGFTAYRIPQGSYLAVTGSFELLNLKNGVCTPPSGDPHYERCAALGNVKQCVCTVSSPPTCGQSCDGDYYVAVVRAEPGKDVLITLNDGNGACVAGVPTKVVN